MLETLSELSHRLPLVFPIHPRTRGRIEDAGLGDLLQGSRIFLTEPLGYLQLLGLMAEARLVMTDSGGLQEETTALGVPCITLRENTERPITVTQGTNTIVGTNAAAIRACFDDVLATGGKAGRIPALWDGHAADRIAEQLVHWADSRVRVV
jgi:UDP-N-acetylglucosamine 2-epimerase (non-hydrolysing)